MTYGNYWCLHVFTFVKVSWQASLVVQWARIHLPMQGTRLRSPVQKDHTCHMPGALSQCSTSTKPTCPTPEADAPRERAPHQERACTQWGRLSTVKKKNGKTALAFKSSLYRHSSHKPSGRLLVIMADPRSWICKCSELWPQETQTRLPIRCREHSFIYFLFASCPPHGAQHRGGARQMLPERARWILSPHPGRD